MALPVTCSVCQYYKDDVEGVGKCKAEHIETRINEPQKNVIHRTNCWPIVSGADSGCGDGKLMT